MVQPVEVAIPAETLPVPMLSNALQLVRFEPTSAKMPKVQVLVDAVQLVKVAPTPTENPRSTVLDDAVQFVRLQPLMHAKPVVPVLSCTWQDSSTAAGPAR